MTLGRRPPPPRKPREPDEFASYQAPRPRAVMATRLDVLRPPASLISEHRLAELQPQRVPSTTTDAERDYMGRVAALGCIVCRLLGFGPTSAQVHHIREGQGAAQRAGNHLTLPLCEPHHQGRNGIHGDKGCLRQLRMTEWDLLDITIGEVFASKTPVPAPPEPSGAPTKRGANHGGQTLQAGRKAQAQEGLKEPAP